MIPIDQTIVGENGNCMSACLASILECDLSEVPNFIVGCNEHENPYIEFNRRINEYLRPLGLVHIEIKATDNWFDYLKNEGVKDLYHLYYGPTIRGTFHAVVAKDGVIVHDPHPDKTSLDTDKRDEWSIAFLVAHFGDCNE